MTRFIRGTFLSFAVVAIVATAAPALAAASCSFNWGAATATVHLTAHGDTATIGFSGGKIRVNGTSCGGSATLKYTDLVHVDAPAIQDATIVLDVPPQAFAPGGTDEPGGSDEIEFDIDLASGGELRVVAAITPDTIVVGSDGINLNGAEGDGVDVDVTHAGVDAVVVDGAGGNDLLTGEGGAATGAPYAGTLSLDGGAGADMLISGTAGGVLRGGSGFDTVDYSSRSEDLSLSMGTGADDGAPGEGDDIGADVEHVVGGSGNDVILGSESAELLEGGPGNDLIEGNGGDDQLEGGPGDDDLRGGAFDDLLVGGPGNDREDGGGFNDVSLGTEKSVYSYQGNAAGIPDVGWLTTRVDVPEGAGTIYDVDARIDIDHPTTEHLKIVLISPEGRGTGLSNFRGNGTPFRGTVFDSESTRNIRNTNDRPFEGRYHPMGSMSVFDGQEAGGQWRLEIRDAAGGSVGYVNGWSVQLTLLTEGDDGADVVRGDVGRDLIDYAGRADGVSVTLQNGADDGRSGEGDDIGEGLEDVEDAYGGAGNDSIVGTWVRNDLRGEQGDDHIRGLPGHDLIRGQQGNDTLDGAGGADFVSGGAGEDMVEGGPGVDVAGFTEASAGVVVDLSSGTTSGGDGSDVLSGLENVAGSGFSDRITGNAGPNGLNGKGGNDEIFGLAGDDRLEGGPGSDLLDGGDGTDTCLTGESLTSCEH